MNLRLLICLIALPACLQAQTYRLALGEEMKLKKGTSDLNIVAADNSGIYVAESRVKSNAFSFSSAYEIETRLIKFDNNYQEVYAKDFKKELDDYWFHSFQAVGNDLFLFARFYEKKEKALKVYAAKIDKEKGELLSPLKEVSSHALENKRDEYQLRVEAMNDDQGLLMVSDISAADRTQLAVDVLDLNLQKRHSVQINLAYAPGRYRLEDVKATAANELVLLGREMEEITEGKKKQRLVFKQYRLSVYTAKGVRQSDAALDVGSRYVISGKLIRQRDGNMLLAGFYSSDAKKAKLNGFFTARINTANGEMSGTAFQEITRPVATSTDKAVSDSTLANLYAIRTVEENPADDTYLITAEANNYERWQQSSTDRVNNQIVTNWVTWHRFTNNEIMVINAEKSGNIRWLTVVPKSQVEEFRSNSGVGGPSGIFEGLSDYFAKGGGMPYYSSYKTMLRKGQLLLLFNDHTDNRDVLFGATPKKISDFQNNSSLFAVSVDLPTGKAVRKAVSVNSEDMILMPRHSYVLSNEILFPSLRGRLLGKTILKVARLSIK